MIPSLQSNFTIFLSPQVDTLCQFAINLHSYSQPHKTLDLPSVAIDLTLLDIAYQWNHTICIVFCIKLLSIMFEIHCCSINQWFISFYCCVVFHCMDILHFIYLCTSWWAFGLFTVLAALWIMLLLQKQKNKNKYTLCGYIYMGGRYLGVELSACMINFCLAF